MVKSFSHFGITKIIFLDADERFAWISKKHVQETLLIPVHAVARGNHKTIINEGFHQHSKKVKKINSAEKVSLHQWLLLVFFSLCDWNPGPVDETDIDRSVVDMRREFPFQIDLSPSTLRVRTSEGQKYLDNFDTALPLMLIFLTFWSLRIDSYTWSCATNASL